MNETLKYYNENANDYFDASVKVDMSELYSVFLPLIPSGGSILDIGCGSGRDLKYFKERGYDAEGLELSSELRKLAEVYSGCRIYEGSIQDFCPLHNYDALWACASLLHLKEAEIFDLFKQLDRFLKPGGILLASMKSGIPTGPDSKNRYFTNFTEDSLNEILIHNKNLELVKLWYSKDTMNRKDFQWLNFIIRLSETLKPSTD